jgi:glycosyltransferase involved in cell wall biosynthesis
MKFLMVTSVFPEQDRVSDALIISLLSRKLMEHGHEVHVAFSEDATLLKNLKPCKQDRNITLHPIRLPLGRFNLLFGLLSGSPLLLSRVFDKMVKSLEPDVIHYHNVGFLGYKALKKPTTSCISILTCHDYWPICQESLLSGYGRNFCPREHGKSCLLGCVLSLKPHIPQLWRYTGHFEKAMKNLDAIVVPSRFLQEKLQEEYSGIHIMRIPFFAPISPEEYFQLLNERPCLEPYFLFSGKLEPNKGLKVAVEAFSRSYVRDATKLVISGRGPLVTWLLKWIKSHKLENRIIYLGWLPHALCLSIMYNAYAVIVPSYSDAFPLVALEALSLGVPVIGSRTGGLIDILEDFERLMFPPGDPESLKKIMDSFDPTLFPRKQVKAIYERKFSIENHYQQYMQLISSLC